MGLFSWSFLLITATTVIWYGSKRGLNLFESFLSESVEVAEQSSMKMWTAILMPIFGSLVLVVMFYFLDWLSYLLIGLMSLSSLIGITFVFHPLFEYVFTKCKLNKECTLKHIGLISSGSVAAFIFSIICVGIWIGTKHWVMIDFLAICLAITAISFIRLPNLKISMILLGLFFVYDIFWVFLSEYLFGKSVMADVAIKLPGLPMVIILPEISILDPFRSPRGYSLLGVGDIVLPGLFLAFLYRFDNYQQSIGEQPAKALKQVLVGYFWRALLFYVLGFVSTIVAVYLMDKGQPALLYLVPFTMVVTIVTSLYRKEFGMLWRGVPLTNLPVTSDKQELLLNQEEDVEEKKGE